MEMSAEMLKNLTILTIPSSEGSYLKIFAATAFEFLKTYKSNCVLRTHGKFIDSG